MTIKDIARESGYAVSTVSRALNNHPDVSEEAKRRIEAVVKARGFEPNSNARQLKRRQAKSIAFVVKSTTNMFFADMLVELQRLVNDAGYDGVVQYLDENDNEVAEAKKICREIKPKGLVFLGGDSGNFITGFKQIKVPSVLATVVMDELRFDNLSMVGVNDRAAGEAAINLLTQKGHRNICIIGADPAVSTPTKLRLKGCLDTLKRLGIPFEKSQFLQASFTWESAYDAMKLYLENNKAPTAVFATSDTQAIGAVRAILDAGLSVPGDISIVGFDGTPITRYYNPTLATMVQPGHEIAKASIKLLLKCIERENPAQTILLEARYQTGDSVRAL